MTVPRLLRGSGPLLPVLTIALLCLFLLASGPAGAAIPITGPTVITEPGSYYLANDIKDCTEPIAILIQCSNVVLDGKGKTIDGMDKTESYGIQIYNAAMTLVNIIIRNVVLSDWDSGIFINDVKNSRFEKITSKSNLNHGVLVARSMGNTFTKITATDNKGVGVLLYSQSNHNTLTEITSQNNGEGVRLRYSNGNRLEKSVIMNNAGEGVNFNEEANFNTIIKNTINGNGKNGIYVLKSNYNTITQNTLTGNKWTGIYCEQSNYNVISGNTVKDCGTRGIYLYDQCVDNAVSNNVIQNSTTHGIVIREKSNDNLINGNKIDKNGEDGLILNAADQNVIFDNLVRENAVAGIWVGVNAKNNVIFNNYFYNVNNTMFVTTNANTWNLTRGEVKSITGGKFSGGNSWGQPNGQGFSQITPDSNKDGICDSPYTLAANNIDKLPLKFKKK
ncbi:MAG: NosD domain-containing protein [Methanolinea sp.]|jgi:parallel beta-helix repeat protein|nr:NosD domain-containing protein [Methanolinea sp.]